MSFIGNIIKTQRQGVEQLSLEEIEEIVESVDDLESDSDEIDSTLDEIDSAEEAVATMESLIDLIGTFSGGLSQESYVQSMSVVSGVLRTARLSGDLMELSTEDAESETPEARKTGLAEKIRANAGKVKDAVVEGIRRLFGVIRDFIMKFFDRIERLGEAAKSRIEALKAPEAPEQFSVPKSLVSILDSMNALKSANAQLGSKATEAVGRIKVGGDNNAAISALRDVTNFQVPKLFASPHMDSASGRLVVEWPAELNASDRTEVSKAKLADALQQVVAICDVIKNQRNVLKNSALTANEASLSRVFNAEESAKQFGAALKLINGVYKSWASYVGRVCNEVVKMASSPRKDDAQKA